MMKTLLHLLILSYLIVPTLFAGDFDTPHGTISLMLKAAETGDADLWAAGLSDSDRDSVKYVKNSPNYLHTISDRARIEQERGNKFKGTDEEFFMARWIVGIPETLRENETENDLELFKQHFILDEFIWNNQYAEVRAMIPVSIKGPIGSMMFPLIREHGKWKLAQWLAEDIYYGTGRPHEQNHARFLSTRLKTRALLTINRSDCSSLKERHWQMPAEISAFYESKYQKTSGFAQQRVMEYWLITGDKKAFKYANNDPKYSSFLKELGKNIPASYQPCSVRNKFNDNDITNITPERWFEVSRDDIVSLNNLIRAFPGNPKWNAKAELAIADLYKEHTGYQNFVIAEAKYRKVIQDYPAQNESSEAKIKLADLYWNHLKKQKEAIDIWKDLEAHNQLPLDTPYTKTKVIPSLIYDDDGEGLWYPPVGDFLPIDSHTLIFTSQRMDHASGPTTTSLASYDILLKKLKYLPVPLGGPFKELQTHPSGYFAINPSKSVLIDRNAVPQRLLIPETTYFISLQYQTSGEIHDGISTLAWDMGDRDMLVWHDDTIGRFDYAGNHLATYPIPDCIKGTDNRIVRNKEGALVYISSSSVCFTKRVGDNTTELRSPYSMQGKFQRAYGGIKTDNLGNIYLLVTNDNPVKEAKGKIIKFAEDGSFKAEYEWDKSGSLGFLTIGPDGNIYVLIWDKNAPSKIVTFNNELEFIGEIDAQKILSIPPHTPVMGFEVDSKNAYLLLLNTKSRSRYNNIEIVSLAGANIGKIVMDVYINTLLRNNKGQMYASGSGKIYRLDDNTVKLFAVPDLPPYDVGGTTIPPINFRFGPNDELYGNVWNYGIVHYDSISSKPIKIEPDNPNIFAKRITSIAVSSKGLLYTLVAESYIVILDPKTGATKILDIDKSPRQEWHITEAYADGSGNFYLYDTANINLLKYDKNGKYVGEFGLRPYSITAFPCRIRIDDAGNVFSMFMAGWHYEIYRFAAADIKWR